MTVALCSHGSTGAAGRLRAACAGESAPVFPVIAELCPLQVKAIDVMENATASSDKQSGKK